jgi:hypothetical protein
MHAARVKAIRERRLDDVDLGNRRIAIDGRSRPLDDLTREVLLEWLAYRTASWPSTANPYLLVNHRGANGTGPVRAPATSPRQHCGGRASPWNGSASTGNSRRPSPSAPTHCIWPRCSASTPRPRSATRKTHGNSSSQPPKSKIPQAAKEMHDHSRRRVRAPNLCRVRAGPCCVSPLLCESAHVASPGSDPGHR